MENKNKTDSTDCLACRVVSSGGLAIAAAYVYRQSMNQKTKFNRNGMLLISTGTNLFFSLSHSLSLIECRINMSKMFIERIIFPFFIYYSIWINVRRTII